MELPVDAAYQAAGVTRTRSDTLQDLAEKLASVPLLYDPGTRWSYSLATDICGYLVELISGQPFDEFLKERIFEPLAMHDTDFSVADSALPRFAACYVRGLDKRLKLQDDPAESHRALLQHVVLHGGPESRRRALGPRGTELWLWSAD